MTQEQPEKSVCGVLKADGKRCQSRVRPGTGPCAWHAKTLKQKIKAWARNQTVVFVLAVVGACASIAGVIGWAYDEFRKSAPPKALVTDTVTAVPGHGNAVTTAPNSPAITGNGNAVTYGQPPAPLIKPVPHRAHIHVMAVDLVSAVQGEVVKSRVHFQNDGDAPVTESRNYIAMAVLPFSEDVEQQTALEDKLAHEAKEQIRTMPIVPNEIPAHSIVLNSDNEGTTKLTQAMMDKVKAGTYAIYLVGEIWYRDSGRLRYSSYCSFTKGDVVGMKLCFHHNQEP